MSLRSGRASVLVLALTTIASLNPSALEAQAPAPSEGWVYGAGDSAYGQLGPTVPAVPAIRITSAGDSFADVVSAKTGGQHTLLLRGDGSVWGMGFNGYGQIGTDGATLRPIQGLPSVIAIAAGASHSLAVDASGHVWAWGSNATGQLGNGDLGVPYSPVPLAVSGLPPAVDVAAGLDFSLALTADGEVWGWGDNLSMQLGAPGPSTSLPTRLALPPLDVANIAARIRTALLRTSDGRVFGWGSSSNGQLGVVSSALPVIQLASGISAAALGDGHILLARSDGHVLSRGLGTSGQLGDGSQASSTAFVTVPGLSGVRAVSAGRAHSLALREDGSVWSWGANLRDQLGRTSSSAGDASTPGTVIGFPLTARALDAAGDTSLFVLDPPTITAAPSAPLTASCGAGFDVSLTMKAYDFATVNPSEIVLVLDESGSIDAPSFQQLKQFAISFVNAQNIGANANRVGIVMFDDTARTIISLSSSKPALISAISSILQGAGSTCIGCGLDAARVMLQQARAGAERRMIVVTDGVNTVNPTTLPQSIANAQLASTVFAIGVGPQVSQPQIVSIASTLPGVKTAFFTPDYSTLTVIVADLAIDVRPALSNLSVSMDLSPLFPLIGAPSASSGSIAANGSHLTWTIPQLGANPTTATLPVRGSNRGGFVPVLDAWTYQVPSGSPVSIGVPSVTISGCPASVVLDPPAAERVVGQTHTVVATILDDFGAPAVGPPNQFGIDVVVLSGPNAGRHFATGTDAQGSVAFSYSSADAGQDLISARAATPSPIPDAAPVTVDWRLPNAPPTADAGPDQVITLNGGSTAAFTLTGSGADDGQIEPLTFSWSESGTPLGAGPVVTLARPLGVYTFTLAVSDGELSATDSVVVSVRDLSPPVIAASVTGPLGNDGWYVGPVTVAWIVSDPESPVTAASGCDPVLIATDFASKTFTCKASSAGGPASATVTLKRDATPPQVTPPKSPVVEATGPAGAFVKWIAPGASDATSGIASVECTPASGDTFPLGETAVKCVATDLAGNTTLVSFPVTVQDTTPPALAGIPADQTLEATSSTGAPASWPSLQAQDLVDGKLEVDCSPTSDSTFPLGTTLVKCLAQDRNGNQASGSFAITVRDTTAPVISGLPGALRVQATTPSGAVVSWPAPTAADLVSGAVAVTCSPASGSTFAIGTFNVTCAAADAAGNTAAATFAVTVVDDTEPGRMFGEGHVQAPNNHKVDFEFSVLETRRGFEWGRVEIKVKDTRRRHDDDDRFEATSVDFVRFSNAPDYGPGRNSPTGIDTVIFTGTGRWERQRGYSYTVEASDRGEPGRGRDTFTIEVRAPNGQVVFSGGGSLTDGNVQSTRLWRPWAWWHGGDRR